jgi:hypothetical protein
MCYIRSTHCKTGGRFIANTSDFVPLVFWNVNNVALLHRVVNTFDFKVPFTL